MITVSYGSNSATLRSVTPADDRREYDQSMIVRRTRGNNLIAYRDSDWHDFDTVIIDSKHNIEANATDFKTLLQLAHGQIIEVEVEYDTGEVCNAVHKLYTGIIVTPMVEVITVQDDCSYDIRFELLIETETDL